MEKENRKENVWNLLVGQWRMRSVAGVQAFAPTCLQAVSHERDRCIKQQEELEEWLHEEELKL